MTDNNKKILEEFRKKYISQWMVDDGTDKMYWKDRVPTPNEIIDFWLQKLQEERMRERAKHRDAGCKCGECQQDNINIQYNRLKSEEKA